MGYITSFKITYDARGQFMPQCEHFPAKGAKFCPQCGKEMRQIPLNEVIDQAMRDHDAISYAMGEACKWYEWKEDMIAFSKKFPKVCFKVHGEGEESGDIWDAYFLNGKYQTHKARVLIDECDPNKWISDK